MRFWEARLIPQLVADHVTGQTREALVADKDWSPEQGPQDALGVTYAQELVWALFTNYHTASEVLGRGTPATGRPLTDCATASTSRRSVPLPAGWRNG